MTEHASIRRGGFSLLELVLVVVILASETDAAGKAYSNY